MLHSGDVVVLSVVAVGSVAVVSAWLSVVVCSALSVGQVVAVAVVVDGLAWLLSALWLWSVVPPTGSLTILLYPPLQLGLPGGEKVQPGGDLSRGLWVVACCAVGSLVALLDPPPGLGGKLVHPGGDPPVRCVRC